MSDQLEHASFLVYGPQIRGDYAQFCARRRAFVRSSWTVFGAQLIAIAGGLALVVAELERHVPAWAIAIAVVCTILNVVATIDSRFRFARLRKKWADMDARWKEILS